MDKEAAKHFADLFTPQQLVDHIRKPTTIMNIIPKGVDTLMYDSDESKDDEEHEELEEKQILKPFEAMNGGPLLDELIKELSGSAAVQDLVDDLVVGISLRQFKTLDRAAEEALKVEDNYKHEEG